jgi:hypothetical protein
MNDIDDVLANDDDIDKSELYEFCDNVQNADDIAVFDDIADTALSLDTEYTE